jgi:hypothetical protein
MPQAVYASGACWRRAADPILLGQLVGRRDAEYLDFAKFEARQRDLVTRPRWVIDGNYNSTQHVRLEAADTVIFMDLLTRSCLRGILTRQLRHGAARTAPLASTTGSPPGVLRYVLGYRRLRLSGS